MPNGAWACLLNSYEPVNVSPSRPSRGLLVPTILAANDPEQLLQSLVLSNYMPFRLLIGSKVAPMLYHWDGKALRRRAISTLPYFVSSSSWQAERVLAERATTFKMWVTAHPLWRRINYAVSTELPARQVRMAAKALKPRIVPVSITEQIAA